MRFGAGLAHWAGRTTRALSPAFARGALALPHLQAPEVAPDLARIDLAARQVHVRAGDEVALVAGQRHPLGQHVVGVRQARAAIRPRLVGNVTQYSLSSVRVWGR